MLLSSDWSSLLTLFPRHIAGAEENIGLNLDDLVTAEDPIMMAASPDVDLNLEETISIHLPRPSYNPHGRLQRSRVSTREHPQSSRSLRPLGDPVGVQTEEGNDEGSAGSEEHIGDAAWLCG